MAEIIAKVSFEAAKAIGKAAAVLIIWTVYSSSGPHINSKRNNYPSKTGGTYYACKC